MTRKEQMALKRAVSDQIYTAVRAILQELNNTKDVISFHETKDKLINKASTNIVGLVKERPGGEK